MGKEDREGGGKGEKIECIFPRKRTHTHTHTQRKCVISWNVNDECRVAGMFPLVYEGF